MRITSIILKHYKPFSFSNIHHFQADFISPITVIVGTNGSGKSTLLKMLNPLPPTRTDFHSGGYKELHITHENKEYVLTSDFSNKISPHSFIVDNTELNIGGTTGVQEELVFKHFGYGNIENNLLRMEVDVCRMGKAERKNLFLTLNPTDLSLVLDIYKKCVSKLKEFKNNLSHLYKRKEEIESKLISKETLIQTTTYKKQLEEQKNTFDRLIYALNQHITYLKEKFNITGTETYPTNINEQYLSYFKNTKTILTTFSDMDTVNVEEHLIQTNIKEIHITNEITRLKNEINDLDKEIKEYQIHMNSFNDKPIATIEKDILSLDTLINSIVIDENSTSFIDSTKEEKVYDLIEQLKPRLVFLSTRSSISKIWTKEIMNKVLNKLDFINKNIDYLKSKVMNLEHEIKLATLEKDKFNIQVPTQCKSFLCELRDRYTNKKDKVDTIIKDLVDKRNGYIKKIKHLRKVYSHLGQMYERHKPFIETMWEVSIIWNNNSELSSIHLPHDLKHILDYVPLSLLQHIHHALDNSKNIRQKNMYMEKREILQKEIDALIKANATSKKFMENLMKDKMDKLTQLLKILDLTKIDLDSILNKKYKLMRFKEFKSQIDTDYKEFSRQCDIILGNKCMEYYQYVITASESLKSKVDQELRDIDILLQEQHALHSRYQKEVIEQIEIIEKEKNLYLGIEKELSPNTGLPHKHLVKFINGLIHNTNYFIAQVFSYPMKLSKLDINEPMDFSLEVTVGDIKVKDISFLSKGQHEMMTIAWTLAILLQKEMLDKYPLFLDEIGGSFDPTHQVALLELLKSLQDQHMVNQMFIINHMAIYSEGFNNTDIIALKTDDAVLTNRINEHIQIS